MAQSGPASQSNSKEDKNDREPEPKKVKPLGPADEFNRGVPRSSLKGYLKAARDGDFQQAAEYLDLRYLPGRMDKSQGPQLARQLKIALDKELWFDLETISARPDGYPDNGLPPNRDIIGRIETPEKPYKVGQRINVKGHDGVVEEIGLRSTRIRLLSGHQTAIPNEEMAKIDIENIGQRPHIYKESTCITWLSARIVKLRYYHHKSSDMKK